MVCCDITLMVFQDSKLKDSLMIGRQDIALEDKTVTIYHGNDMVNVDVVNFVCSSRDIAQVPATFLALNMVQQQKEI